MSMLSAFWRKADIKGQLNKRLKSEIDGIEGDIASRIFQGSGGRITLIESKTIAAEIVFLDLKKAVDKVF